jgi:hypothetical protein
MTTVAEVVEFRRDLFFEGAVQIGWFENDISRRDKAASNFVFHGPEYHGVAADDIVGSQSYRLTDTVSFTRSLVEALKGTTNQEYPISLAIAGYGTGKSHLALTLATIFSDPESDVSQKIFSNLKQADPVIGAEISLRIQEFSSPILVIPINGMGNFDLASELSKQALRRLKSYGLDTSVIDDLWPRFQYAYNFVERNFDIRQNEFFQYFGNDICKHEILSKISDHDDFAFQHVNEIYEQVNGTPLRATGEESPSQLIETLCAQYCGPNKPFQSMLILFDEFGRYLEFAADRPHIAGDAALQQIYEGVQNNSDKCSLLCLNQYELKVYLSRISRDSQSTIQRYITRYDSAKKYYLSSNLETLFAHLIEKKDTDFISKYLLQSKIEQQNNLKNIQRWFPSSNQQSVWRDDDLFQQVIVKGCWPLHPLATWFLCRSSDYLQQRSAITFVADAFERAEGHFLGLDDEPWTISATALFDSPLIKELITAEEYGQGGAVAQSYEAVTQKYQNDFSNDDRHVLLAVLIASKLGMKVRDQQEAHDALRALSGLSQSVIDHVTHELVSEYGVLEWNERFLRYEIIGDAVPRSTFLTFLRKKTQDISLEQIEEIFSAHCKVWAELKDETPQFAVEQNISSPEWNFFTSCTHLEALPQVLDNALHNWKNAIKPDEDRGQLIYCYVRADEKLESVSSKIENLLEEKLKGKINNQAPILVVLFHDEENTIKKYLAEYFILTGALPPEDQQRFSHFIEDHKNKLIEELKLACEEATKKRNYCFSSFFKITKLRLKKTCHEIFSQSYPEIIPFPFDGFATTRGNAAKDCRLITAELLSGNLDQEWVATQTPQTMNRAKRLMRTWDAMGDDGLVRMHPRNRKFGALISHVETLLETEKIINIGQLFKRLIAPPYGFNIASAGLALGVFMAPRKNIAVLSLDDQTISPGAWIGQAFTGNFLNDKILDKTVIRYVSDSEAGEWQRLLSKWDMELTHLGNLSYLEKANQLQTRVALPPGELFERYTRLEESTHKSIEALRSLDNFYENELKYFENAYRRREAGNMSRVATDLLQRINTMENQHELWIEEQYVPIKELYNQAREAVIQFFDDWLLQQSCLSSQNVPDFRRRLIDKIGKNLELLGLNELADKIKAHARHIISQIEERQRVLYIVQEAQAFLDSHQSRINNQSRVVQLRNWMYGARGLIGPLTEAGQQVHAPEIQNILRKIDSFQGDCKATIQKHEDRFARLWDISFNNIDDIKQAQREVDQLLSIFSEDNPANLEDLYSMQQQLREFENDLISWEDLTISNDDLKKMVKIRIDSLLSDLTEEDELPWDTEEIYLGILDQLLRERENAASYWFSGSMIDDSQIEKMDAMACRLNLKKIETPPNYLSEEQIKEIDQLRYLLKKRMNDLQLDGVLEMFNNLSHDLQEEFIKIVMSKS